MLSTQFNRDNQYQTTSKPSLLAACIALALLPSAAFAAPATEETVIVEGSATTPVDCNQVNHLIPTRVLVKGGEITCKILK